MDTRPGANFHWLLTGEEFFHAVKNSIGSARESVCLETYLFSSKLVGEEVRDALVAASKRKVRVRVLIDALGSYGLPGAFWKSLTSEGGEVRLFNPLSLNRLGIRNHRKLIICDQRLALVGGFNIAPEYSGDGVTNGWCDLGASIEGALVQKLHLSFEEMFSRADLKHKLLVRFRKSSTAEQPVVAEEELLLGRPGRGGGAIKRALHRDLAGARSVQLMVAYFLPPRRLRRRLTRIARRGARVQLILAGKTDVPVSQLAARSLYRRLLHGGVQVFEYQPQILHAKLFIIDDAVYLGSANLDPRSLGLNYELLLRLEGPAIAEQARHIFSERLKFCTQVQEAEWDRSRSFWDRLRQRWAYFLLVRIDPYLARRQFQVRPD